MQGGAVGADIAGDVAAGEDAGDIGVAVGVDDDGKAAGARVEAGGRAVRARGLGGRAGRGRHGQRVAGDAPLAAVRVDDVDPVDPGAAAGAGDLLGDAIDPGGLDVEGGQLAGQGGRIVPCAE